MKYATTGIDIGTESLKVSIVEHDTKTKTHRAVGFFKYPLYGIRKGTIINEFEFKRSFKSAINAIQELLHFKIDSALVSTSSSHIESFFASTSGIISKINGEITRFDIELLEKQLDESVYQKNRRVIFSKIIEYKIDGKSIFDNPEGYRGVKIEIRKIYISISTSQYDLIESSFLENNIEMIHLFPKGITASEFGISEKEKVVGVGYLDIGAETTSLCIFEENKLIGYSILPIGSNDITNDIALVLKVSLEEAESIKHGTSQVTYPKKKVDEIINSRIDDIGELTNNYLKKIKRSELLPGGLVLNGGGVEISSIEEQLKLTLNLPVKKMIFEVSTLKKGTIKQTEYLECYGLSIKSKDMDSEHIKKPERLAEKIKKSGLSFFRQFLP